MNSHRTTVSNSTPCFEVIEDIARMLQVSSVDLRERLCPDRAQQLLAYWLWLKGTSVPPQALHEIRQAIIDSKTPDLEQIETHFEHLFGHISHERKH
ncbi:MAG: hypothetical protein AAGA50_29980 [Pseudomonadota bacterium]